MQSRFLDSVLREAASAAADLGGEQLSDADLLTRFVTDQNHSAFTVLVNRHARLVWAVCRQVTMVPTDAEDAFQAVWLALVNHAHSIRRTAALPAWLHGTAYRISIKANQSGARRRRREARTAQVEKSLPVPDSVWDTLLAIVHEEIARLPEGLRTAFVVCDLEGVPPGVAARRLGWKPGTLSGRLCQARQALVSQLTKRGLAPTAALAGCGIGVATTSATVPSTLLVVAASLPAATTIIPSTIFELAKAVTEGTMTKLKLLAAGILVASLLGLGGASVVAQFPGAQNRQPETGLPPIIGSESGDGQLQAPTTGFQGMSTGLAAQGSTSGRANPNSGRWQYKLDPLPSDRNLFITLLQQRDNEGWEYCGTVSFAGTARAVATGNGQLGIEGGADGETVAASALLQMLGQGGASGGASVDLVFRRPKSTSNRNSSGIGNANGATSSTSGFSGGVQSIPGKGVGTSNRNTFGGGGTTGIPESGRSGNNKPESSPLPNNQTLGDPLVGGYNFSGGRTNPQPVDTETTIKIIPLKRSRAREAAVISEQLFGGQLTVAVDESTNSVILKGSSKSLEAVVAVLEKLDDMNRANTRDNKGNELQKP